MDVDVGIDPPTRRVCCSKKRSARDARATTSPRMSRAVRTSAPCAAPHICCAPSRRAPWTCCCCARAPPSPRARAAEPRRTSPRLCAWTPPAPNQGWSSPTRCGGAPPAPRSRSRKKRRTRKLYYIQTPRRSPRARWRRPPRRCATAFAWTPGTRRARRGKKRTSRRWRLSRRRRMLKKTATGQKWRRRSRRSRRSTTTTPSSSRRTPRRVARRRWGRAPPELLNATRTGTRTVPRRGDARTARSRGAAPRSPRSRRRRGGRAAARTSL